MSTFDLIALLSMVFCFAIVLRRPTPGQAGLRTLAWIALILANVYWLSYLVPDLLRLASSMR